MTIARRWDGDDRGHGVGDATQLIEGALDLVAAFGQAEWVAEEPESHLLPHIEAWCQSDSRLRLAGARTDDHGAYVVDLSWAGASGAVGATRAAVFSLIGSFAESATYVRQRRGSSGANRPAITLQFEVGTGELAPDASFAPHGHVVVINVSGVL